MKDITHTNEEGLGLISKLPINNTKTFRKFKDTKGTRLEIRKIGNDSHELNTFSSQHFKQERQTGHYVIEGKEISTAIGELKEEDISIHFGLINNELLIQKRIKKLFKDENSLSDQLSYLRGMTKHEVDEYNSHELNMLKRWVVERDGLNSGRIQPQIRTFHNLERKLKQTFTNRYQNDLSYGLEDRRGNIAFDSYLMNNGLIIPQTYEVDDLTEENEEKGTIYSSVSRLGNRRLFQIVRDGPMIDIFATSQKINILSDKPIWAMLYSKKGILGYLESEDPSWVCDYQESKPMGRGNGYKLRTIVDKEELNQELHGFLKEKVFGEYFPKDDDVLKGKMIIPLL